METPDKVKVVISDCHLSAGRFYEGRFNPHEDFFFDDEMCDMLEYFSSGKYGEGPRGPVDVELVINGDYFDFLNVPVNGEFEDTVTEELAVYKLEAILAGHPKVMKGLRAFASKPGKRITYMIGNHDADLFFAKVRERIIREWDPQGQYPSEKVRIIHDTDRLVYEEGIEIRHGNQFEAASALDFDQPILDAYGQRVLNLPWGSVYILKIINRMKWEREYLDKIRPVKVLILFGLIIDPLFTIRFTFYTAFYYIKARFLSSLRSRKQSGLFGRFKEILALIREELMSAWQDGEKGARDILESKPEIHTVIMGHTHWPMHRFYPNRKQYINTGTWTKMVYLHWRGMQQEVKRSFALIEIKDGQARCELRQWVGEHNPHKFFNV